MDELRRKFNELAELKAEFVELDKLNCKFVSWLSLAICNMVQAKFDELSKLSKLSSIN